MIGTHGDRDMTTTLATEVQIALERHLQTMQSGRNRIGPPRDLQSAVEKFRFRYGGLGIGHIPQDRLGQAILALQRQGVAALTRGSRYILAYSLARPLSQLGGDSILAQDDLALPLIEAWEKDFRDGVLSPLHWKGLVYSYLQAPPTVNGSRLRILLLSSMAAIIVQHRVKPLWLEVIERHHHLFGRQPCEPYVRELLVGSHERLDELQRVVAIPEHIWLRDAIDRALREARFR